MRKADSNGELSLELSLELGDNLEEWDGVGGGREVQEEGTYVHLWLIYVDI